MSGGPPLGVPLIGAPPSDGVTRTRWARVQELFEAAVLCPPDARAMILDRACEGDAGLRAEVESLLQADADPTPAVLDAPPGVLAAAVHPAMLGASDAPALAAGGWALGPYRVLRPIGRGGMGAVYLAEREDVGNRVALKLLPEGRSTPGAVRRFLAERRVLARLEHPNIARLLDAGLTEAGAPYFAMEYVDGAPLVSACDDRRMLVRDRLALFTQVCDAVAYAHRNLVVHRDLKPSNVLVRADGTVRLLDFGIAKLLSAASGTDPIAGAADPSGSESGAWLMTPRYAAPEQRRGGPITTATDVYALGLLLHELVSGERPPDQLPDFAVLDRAFDGAGRAVFSAGNPDRGSPAPVAPAPSAAVQASRARARGTTADGLRRALAGDVEAIVRRATAEDPAARYASAAELLDDLQRHRTGRPVRAHPGGRAYRAGRFVRRNRWGVAAAAGLFVLLGGTVAVTVVQQARTRVALSQARAEADKAQQVTKFVTALFEDADPFRAAGPLGATPGGPAEGILGAGAARLEQELASQPAIRAELLRTLGVVARNLGRSDAAEALLRRGLTTRRQVLGVQAAPDAELAGLLHELGVVRRVKGDYAGADTLLAQALAIRTALPGRGGADLTDTRFELGVLRGYQGRVAEAERLLGATLAARQRVGGPGLADAYLALANVRYPVADAESGVALARRAIVIRQRWFGPDHPSVAEAYVLLAAIQHRAGHLDSAERTIRGALAMQRRHLIAEHPSVARSESELAWLLVEQGKYAEAESLQQRALAARQRSDPDGSRDVAGSLYSLGFIRYKRGDLANAADLMHRAAAMRLRLSGPEHEEGVAEQRVLAVVEALRGDEAAALAVTGRVLRAEHASGDDSSAARLAALAAWLGEEGRCTRSAALYRRATAAAARSTPRPTAPASAGASGCVAPRTATR